MKLEAGKISSLQLIFLVIGFMVGTSALIPPGNSAGRDTWLAILAGFTESLIFFLIYYNVGKNYMDRNIIEINNIVLGPWVGGIASIVFIWYTYHAGAMELRLMGEFTETIMPQTPIDVYLVVIVLTCAYVVSKGIEVIARCAVFLVPIFITILIFDTVLSIPALDLSNLLPILDIPAKSFIQSVHSAAAYPFNEIICLAVIVPCINRASSVPGSLLKGLGAACLILMFIAARNTAVLSNLNNISTFPSLTVVSLINIGDILTRMDIFSALFLLVMGFLKVSFFFYAATLGLAQLCKMRTYRPLILPLAVLMYLLGMVSFRTGVDEYIIYAARIWPYYSIPFELIFPLLLLIVAVIRKFPLASKHEGGKS